MKNFFKLSGETMFIMIILIIGYFGWQFIHFKSTTVSQETLNTQMKDFSVDPSVKIVGLGEASHGVAEYHQTKIDIFKALVTNNKAKVFVIEGDFGGTLNVEKYIQGGQGSAKQVVQDIGFQMYHTKELVNLIEWMRNYNAKVSNPSEKLHFYGMDMQRFDFSKKYLFEALELADPELKQQYEKKLNALNDRDRTNLSNTTVKAGQKELLELRKEFITVKDKIISRKGSSYYEVANECLNSLIQYTKVFTAKNYNQKRDSVMFSKVNWIKKHEPNSIIFINGHNGHIRKSSGALYTSLGNRLLNEYKQSYFAIGTDAKNTHFNSQTDNGFKKSKGYNQNELTDQLKSTQAKKYWIKFSDVENDNKWEKIINKKQRMTSFNVTSSFNFIKFFYTEQITPKKSYDALIIYDTVHPSHLYN